jgi:hypothetical protein
MLGLGLYPRCAQDHRQVHKSGRRCFLGHHAEEMCLVARRCCMTRLRSRSRRCRDGRHLFEQSVLPGGQDQQRICSCICCKTGDRGQPWFSPATNTGRQRPVRDLVGSQRTGHQRQQSPKTAPAGLDQFTGPGTRVWLATTLRRAASISGVVSLINFVCQRCHGDIRARIAGPAGRVSGRYGISSATGDEFSC